jgi:hypothetical protein
VSLREAVLELFEKQQAAAAAEDAIQRAIDASNAASELLRKASQGDTFGLGPDERRLFVLDEGHFVLQRFGGGAVRALRLDVEDLRTQVLR